MIVVTDACQIQFVSPRSARQGLRLETAEMPDTMTFECQSPPPAAGPTAFRQSKLTRLSTRKASHNHLALESDDRLTSDLEATDRGRPEQMPSDIIVASLIVAGSILYATRDKSIQSGGTAHFGRREDRINNKLDEINTSLKKIAKFW